MHACSSPRPHCVSPARPARRVPLARSRPPLTHPGGAGAPSTPLLATILPAIAIIRTAHRTRCAIRIRRAVWHATRLTYPGTSTTIRGWEATAARSSSRNRAGPAVAWRSCPAPLACHRPDSHLCQLHHQLPRLAPVPTPPSTVH